MKRRRVLWIFSFLIAAHILHIGEEILGKASFIDSVYNGITHFLLINISLLLIPLILIYLVFLKKKFAHYLAFMYSIVMIIDGLDHLVRNYAGIYTGVLLIILGVALIFYLVKELRNMKGGDKKW